MSSQLLQQLKQKRNSSKGRLRFNNIDAVNDPRAYGLLLYPMEWEYECPNTTKAENIFIYGTNTWGQYLLLSIKWRPLNSTASVCLTFKDDDVLYELKENDTINVSRDGSMRKYNVAGVSIEVLSPFRRLRIRVKGYVRRKDTNQLVYVRFRLFWYVLSQSFDFTSDYDDHFFANEMKSSNGVMKFEDRYEQFGQLKGTIQFESEKEKEIYLWGFKCKQYFSHKLSATRIFGSDTKGFAFHIGSVKYDDGTKYRYGYAYLGIAPVYPITSLLESGDKIDALPQQLQNNSNHMIFNFENKIQNRNFHIEIQSETDFLSDIMVCDLKLNGRCGKTIIFRENLNEDLGPEIDFVSPKPNAALVLPIDADDCQSVVYCGGKGSSIATLYKLSNDTDNSNVNFIVPRMIVVTTNAYAALLKHYPSIETDIEALQQLSWSENKAEVKECCEKLMMIIIEHQLPNQIKDEINENLTNLFGLTYETNLFAVRSSASGEDSEEMSAAGQMTTYLGVKSLNEICNAVMKCWASQFAFLAVEYKRLYGQLINSPMAVVIQEMVNCDSAGVMFTCDPFNGDERKIIITANYGLGESVVFAMADPDTVNVDIEIESNSLKIPRKIKGIESIKIGSKLKSIKLADSSDGGTIETENEENNKCSLSESEIISLANVALEIHKYYGNVRDIEWGIKDGEIYMLQSRPLTNIDTFSEWELMHEFDSGHCSEREYYSRANFGEIYPGACTEMTLSWGLNVWMIGAMKIFFEMMNIDKKEFVVYCFPNGGIISNTLFMSLKSGQPPFSYEPDSTMAKGFQYSFYGHELKDEELFTDCKEKALKKKLSAGTKYTMAKFMLNIIRNADSMLKKSRQQILNFDILKGHNFNTAKELFDYMTINTYQYITIAMLNTAYQSLTSMIYNTMMINFLSNGNNEHTFSDFSLLLSTASDVISAEVPNQLREIANEIEYPQQFISMNDNDAIQYLTTGTANCCTKYREFIARHGHRGYKEFDIGILQWGDNPIPVIRSLKAMLSNKMSKPIEKKSIDAILNSLKTPLSGFKKFMLKSFILPRCRKGVGRREHGKYLWIWTVNLHRQVFWKLAKLMVREGRLPEADLLFHLSYSELERLLLERDASIVAKARKRKQIYPKKDALIFSETNIGPDIKPRNEQNFIYNISAQNPRIKGVPVSSGKVKGRAFVTMSVKDAQNIQHGDILITYSTDIGWSPYFPMLSGLATEIGGLISHGAVIAREYGLPCIIGVEGAAKLFKTGDTVLLDTDSGEIIKIDSETPLQK